MDGEVTLSARALLFDMDGTLVDSRAVIARVLHSWAERHGLDRERVERLPHGQKTRDTIAGLAPHLDLMTEVAALDAAELGDLDGIVEVRGARALLDSLHPGQWALVTSADRELARLRLTAAGLPLPEVMISGESVARGKPDPEGYRMAADRLGVAPAECIVFEDAPAGIAAGLAAGMRVIGVATTSARDEMRACTTIVDDLSVISATTDGSYLSLRVR